MYYKDNALLKDIGHKFIVMRMIDSEKNFKINIKETLKLKCTTSRLINMGELLSKIRKQCGLDKDMIITCSNMELYDNSDLTYKHLKDLWLSKYRFEKEPKAEKTRDIRIIVG
jgi:hypothetical protein